MTTSVTKKRSTGANKKSNKKLSNSSSSTCNTLPVDIVPNSAFFAMSSYHHHNNNNHNNLSQMLCSCAGCEGPILDQYVYNVLNRAWHQSCIQCSDCRQGLMDKCFSREGKLFCLDDFMMYKSYKYIVF